MNIKKILQEQTVEKKDTENKYVPSSSEKKRAITMYFLFGIILSVSKKEFNPFEYYHLKQSMGLRIVFVPMIVLSFIPIIKWICILIIVLLVAISIVSGSNAWKGKYFVDSKNNILDLFSGIGGRFLDLFDLGIIVKGEKGLTSDDAGSTLSELQKEDTTLQQDFEKINEISNKSDQIQ